MVGRGLIGELFAEAGWEVSFLDVDQQLLELLNAQGGYEHKTVSNAGAREKWVPVARSVHVNSAEAPALLAESDLVATSVGARVLPSLAPLLASARKLSGRPIDVLLCENLHAADRRLGYALAALGAEPDDFGLVRTVVGRMIPAAGPDAGAAVVVEPYGELPIDTAAKRRGGELPARVIQDGSIPFDFYEDRKLAVHNLGHFLAALLGLDRGAEYLWQAISMPEIWGLTFAAMCESSAGLSSRYSVKMSALLTYIYDLLERFGNQALADPCTRVARDPQRKLGKGERVSRALELAESAGAPLKHLELARGLALEARGKL
jgi:mannitol-1-phosphate 5-dehydrogenase